MALSANHTFFHYGGSFPSRVTACLSTVALLVSLLIGAVVARYPQPLTNYVFMALLFGLALVISVSYAFDLREGSSSFKKWNSNLTSTFITCLLTLLILPVLYHMIWYSQLTSTENEIQTDLIVSHSWKISPKRDDRLQMTDISWPRQENIQFPSVALLQRLDWSSQANLTTTSRPKCFLGWYDENAPTCSNMTAGDTCSCNDSWSQSITKNFSWQGVEYDLLSLSASGSLVSTQPTFLMFAQAFFTCMRPFYAVILLDWEWALRQMQII